MAKHFALIVAGGSGSRFNNDDALPKQYNQIHGLPVLFHSINAFNKVPQIDEIHVVLSPDDTYWVKTMPKLMNRFNKPVSHHFCGGLSRSESVSNGLKNINATCDNDWILVHDAARPCVQADDLQKLITTCSQNKNTLGGILAVPVADSIKKSINNSTISQSLNREEMWQAQTPQIFRKLALQIAIDNYPQESDEAGAVEKLILKQSEYANKTICLVRGSRDNIKITYPEDIKIASAILTN